MNNPRYQRDKATHSPREVEIDHTMFRLYKEECNTKRFIAPLLQIKSANRNPSLAIGGPGCLHQSLY